MIATPTPRKGVMDSCNIKYEQMTATGSSTVINMPLIPAPIFGIPIANSAVGIVVPATARKIIHKKKFPLKYCVETIL
jgi:repressor of nif and glnA expression